MRTNRRQFDGAAWLVVFVATGTAGARLTEAADQGTYERNRFSPYVSEPQPDERRVPANKTNVPKTDARERGCYWSHWFILDVF